MRECLEADEAGAEDLDTWFADEFFEGHCQLFHQTPFIWHVWTACAAASPHSSTITSSARRTARGDGSWRSYVIPISVNGSPVSFASRPTVMPSRRTAWWRRALGR